MKTPRLMLALSCIVLALLTFDGNAQEPRTIEPYFAESEIAAEHTAELRQAQEGRMLVLAGEDIAFSLDNGINVQFSNGSGRRLLISRGTGYRAFTYPAWSLDGESIAFAAQRNDSRMVDLVVANADGSNPTVILVLNDGYFNSMIQSISWSWDHQFIMFNYAFDDSQLNSYFLVCTIRRNGQNYTYVQDFLRNYSQYEPLTASQRYAYISTGTAFDANTRLRVSNLNGTNDVVWFTFQGAIAGLTHVAWKNANSIYTVIRNWSAYPNREVLLRVDKTTGGSTYTVIVQSDPGGSLWSPTLSPDRTKIYNAEIVNNTSTMWLTTLGANGLPVSVVAKGIGFFPNWRQRIPPPNSTPEDGPGIPKSLVLEQNYPNPFNPSTTIGFQVPERAHVALRVYDMLGKEIATLVDEDMSPGRHAVDWNAAGMSSGVYLCVLHSGARVSSRRMLLLK